MLGDPHIPFKINFPRVKKNGRMKIAHHINIAIRRRIRRFGITYWNVVQNKINNQRIHKSTIYIE